MSTMNVSLPAEQIDFIDRLVTDYNFANRSELVRAIFRFLKRDPTTLQRATVLPLHPPKTKDGNEVMRAFRTTGLYSEDFLSDLEEGINDSGYFTPTTKS